MNCSSQIIGTGISECFGDFNQKIKFSLNLNDFDKITRKHITLLIKQYQIDYVEKKE
jgi:hypothetical protein